MSFNNCSKLCSSDTNTSLALLPSNDPTMPVASSWSISLPARLYPILSFLCKRDVSALLIDYNDAGGFFIHRVQVFDIHFPGLLSAIVVGILGQQVSRFIPSLRANELTDIFNFGRIYEWALYPYHLRTHREQGVAHAHQLLGPASIQNGAGIDLGSNLNDHRAGKLALIIPVITLTEGRCVATTRWMPMARAFWARRAIGSSHFFSGGHHHGRPARQSPK